MCVDVFHPSYNYNPFNRPTTDSIAEAVAKDKQLSNVLFKRATVARFSLKIPAQYDIENNFIQYWYDDNSLAEPMKFVKVVVPWVWRQNRDSYNPQTESLANRLWLEKYSKPMPEWVEPHDPESMGASWFPYDGTRELSNDEWEIVKALSPYDLTLDMLWLLIEGLHLTLGVPLPEDDEKWLPILFEGNECGGYLTIVKQCLGME